jgi:formate-dependent nitrite reductase cytochrome c552 subunit
VSAVSLSRAASEQALERLASRPIWCSIRAEVRAMICAQCKAEFEPKKPEQILCSRACAFKWNKRKWNWRPDEPVKKKETPQ